MACDVWGLRFYLHPSTAKTLSQNIEVILWDEALVTVPDGTKQQQQQQQWHKRLQDVWMILWDKGYVKHLLCILLTQRLLVLPRNSVTDYFTLSFPRFVSWKFWFPCQPLPSFIPANHGPPNIFSVFFRMWWCKLFSIFNVSSFHLVI